MQPYLYRKENGVRCATLAIIQLLFPWHSEQANWTIIPYQSIKGIMRLFLEFWRCHKGTWQLTHRQTEREIPTSSFGHFRQRRSFRKIFIYHIYTILRRLDMSTVLIKITSNKRRVAIGHSNHVTVCHWVSGSSEIIQPIGPERI